MSPSLFFTSTGEVAYYTAGVAVVHDFSASKEAPRNRQRFFQSHDDDILCMTIDPSRNYCATGQVASQPPSTTPTPTPTPTPSPDPNEDHNPEPNPAQARVMAQDIHVGHRGDAALQSRLPTHRLPGRLQERYDPYH